MILWTLIINNLNIGYFDIIWASPECKVFSMLQNTHIGKKWNNKEELENVRKDNSIFINKTIEIIDYLKPEFYFIEKSTLFLKCGTI